MKHLVEINLPRYFVLPIFSGPVTNNVVNCTLHEKYTDLTMLLFFIQIEYAFIPASVISFAPKKSGAFPRRYPRKSQIPSGNVFRLLIPK